MRACVVSGRFPLPPSPCSVCDGKDGKNKGVHNFGSCLALFGEVATSRDMRARVIHRSPPTLSIAHTKPRVPQTRTCIAVRNYGDPLLAGCRMNYQTSKGFNN